MENFVLERCLVTDYFDKENSDLFKLEKSDLVKKIKELTATNAELKKTLQENESSYFDLEAVYREKLFSLTKELDDLKVKYNEVTQALEPRAEFQKFLEQNGTSSNGSMSSKEDEKEQDEEKLKAMLEEERMKLSKRRMIHLIRDMPKSPSIVLRKRDAEYYDNPSSTRNSESSDTKIWAVEIASSLKTEPREKVLAKISHAIQDFIPKKSRAQIWAYLIGNPLRIKKSIYTQLCRSMEACPVSDKVKNQIKEDLTRTYPQLKSFNRGEALNDELQRLLELFHFARPDIGYVQGLGYPAALLLLYMDFYHAFKSLTNLVICRPFLTKLYKFELEEVKAICKVFEGLLKQKVPNAHKHLEKLNISAEVYLIEWLITLFCRSFHIDEAAKIWDLFLLEGAVAMIKVALKLFQMIEGELVKRDYAETLYYLRSCTSDVDPNVLLKRVVNSRLTQDKFEKLLEKERKKKKDGNERNKSFFY